MKKIIYFLIIMISALIFFNANNLFAQEVKTLEGDVTNVDTLASTFEIKWLMDYDDFDYMMKSFKITEDTKIYKGGEFIDIAELNIDDHVIVEYFVDPASFMQVAKSVEIQLQ